MHPRRLRSGPGGVLLLSGLAVIGLALGMHSVNAVTADRAAFSFSGGDVSIPELLTAALFAAAGLASASVARRANQASGLWWVIAAACALMVVEMLGARLHERLEEAVGVEAGIAIAAAGLAAASILALRALRPLRREVLVLLAGAPLSLVVAQLLSLLAAVTREDALEQEGSLRNLLILGEEGLEMLAAWFILAAALVALRAAPAAPGRFGSRAAARER